MQQIQFEIGEAGCLIYVADRNFGGEAFTKLDDFFGGTPGLEELTRRGAIMAMSLYQDDGYGVCVRVGGELSAEECAQWTSHVAGRLIVESGQLVVSGVIPEDDELSDFEPAVEGESHWSGAIVDVPGGEYRCDIYSYPPNDLAGGWKRIEDCGFFKSAFGQDPNITYEKPEAYFARTRPGESAPAWVTNGFEDATFFEFLVHLTPLAGTFPEPVFEEFGCLQWNYRKPEVFPIGIRL